ncbi:glycosyltransferase family 4 protein [Paracoccaceae bacterium]|nr:glycosyltransferase family 4 protein [Paracoccaceae bacterium]
MKILVVTNSIPFPARHGVELPLENILRSLSSRHEVDLLVYGTSDADRLDFQSRLENVPNSLNSICFQKVMTGWGKHDFLKELAFIRPKFWVRDYVGSCEVELLPEMHYDVIWLSPMAGLGFLDALARNGVRPGKKIVVGLNDATYAAYANGFRYLLKRPLRYEWPRFIRAFRTPWLYFFERKYLSRVDLIHVQTELEKRRVERLFTGMRSAPTVFVARNGSAPLKRPIAVGEVAKSKAPLVLFLTHLSGGRRHESQWFLRKVWPVVVRERPDAKLWLVGSPPKDVASFARTLPPGVSVKGYVDDLGTVLAQAAVGVIPTLHNSGWVNRIGDFLGAGVPLVACTEPLRTAIDLLPGRDALSADKPNDFAQAVLNVLNDSTIADTIAGHGAILAGSFPTWEDTLRKIEAVLQNSSRNEL